MVVKCGLDVGLHKTRQQQIVLVPFVVLKAQDQPPNDVGDEQKERAEDAHRQRDEEPLEVCAEQRNEAAEEEAGPRKPFICGLGDARRMLEIDCGCHDVSFVGWGCCVVAASIL